MELVTSSLTYTYPSSPSAKLQIGTSKVSLSHDNINRNQISILHIANINKPGYAFERRPQHWKATKHERVPFELFVSPFENVFRQRQSAVQRLTTKVEKSLINLAK